MGNGVIHEYRRFRPYFNKKVVKGGSNPSITREDIQLGMAEWLAQGNEITVLDSGTDEPSRRVNASAHRRAHLPLN